MRHKKFRRASVFDAPQLPVYLNLAVLRYQEAVNLMKLILTVSTFFSIFAHIGMQMRNYQS